MLKNGKVVAVKHGVHVYTLTLLIRAQMIINWNIIAVSRVVNVFAVSSKVFKVPLVDIGASCDTYFIASVMRSAS